MENNQFKGFRKSYLFFLILSFSLWTLSFLFRIYLFDSQTTGNYAELEAVKKVAYQNLSENIRNQDSYKVFWFICRNNLEVCIINIAGGVLFGLLTFVNLIKNGFLISDIFCAAYSNGIPIQVILKHTLPHSVEIVGAWISGAIGFSFGKLIYGIIRDNIFPCAKCIKFLGYQILYVAVLTVFAAFVETYISLNLK